MDSLRGEHGSYAPAVREYAVEGVTGQVADLDLLPDGSWIGLAEAAGSPTLHFGADAVPAPSPLREPRVRALSPDTALVVDDLAARGRANAWVIHRSGNVEASFDVGRGIEDVVITPSGIAVTYFDEGVFKYGGVGEEGVAMFDFDGSLLWGYRSAFGHDAVEVADCYAACMSEDGALLFLPYTDFPLVRVNPREVTQEIAATPEALHGAHAISARGNTLFAHNPSDARDALLAWTIGSEVAPIVGSYAERLRGLPGGRFLAVRGDGYSVVAVET